jgi:sulfate adenylyltransferase
MNDRKRELRSAALPELVLSDDDVDLLELLLSGLIALDDLPVSIAERFPGERPLALRDKEGVLLAVLEGERIEVVDPVQRYDFIEHRRRPEAKDGPYLAFPARHAIHRAELEMLLARARERNARLLIIGDSSGEDHVVRAAALQAVLHHAPGARLYLAPLSAIGDDPALEERIARNLGATFFVPASEVPSPLSQDRVRELLHRGAPFPDGFTYAEVDAALRRGHPLRSSRGLTVFFTGLSGSGKSTVGNVVRAKLTEVGPRRVTFLDGDVVRTHLSKGLGFSKEDRDINIVRIGFVASEITKHGGIALCAPIAPYDATRKQVRRMIEAHGAFVLVHVATPIEECERRDRKGLYAKARRGEIKGFTGVDDPYEVPADAELVIDTSKLSREDAADRVLGYLRKEGYVA